MYVHICISSIIAPHAATQHSCYETLSSALFTDGNFCTQHVEQIADEYRALQLRPCRPVPGAHEAPSTEI